MCACSFRPEIAVGSKVLAKKFNDIWYSGVVLDLSKPESTKHPGEVRVPVPRCLLQQKSSQSLPAHPPLTPHLPTPHPPSQCKLIKNKNKLLLKLNGLIFALGSSSSSNLVLYAQSTSAVISGRFLHWVWQCS